MQSDVSNRTRAVEDEAQVFFLRIGAAREVAARARRTALVVITPRSRKGHRAGGKPLSYGARPRCVAVPAAASNLCSRLSRDMRARATALAVTRKEA